MINCKLGLSVMKTQGWITLFLTYVIHEKWYDKFMEGI